MFNWEELSAKWDAEAREAEAMRSRSPILWWFKHVVPEACWYGPRRWIRESWFRLLRLPQRLRQGFWDDETWGLDTTLAEFALPRLRRLRTLQQGYPAGLSDGEWEWILHEIEEFLKWHIERDPREWSREEYERRGALFGKYFGHLWW